MPKGITDEMWDETICDLPAVKKLNKTYADLQEEARLGNHKILTYLNFHPGEVWRAWEVHQIITTGGTKSQGLDLGAWLIRNCWDVSEMPAHTTFQRRM